MSSDGKTSDLATQHAQMAQQNAKGDEEKTQYQGLAGNLGPLKAIESAAKAFSAINANIGDVLKTNPLAGAVQSLTPEVSGLKILGEKIRINLNADSAQIIGQAAAQEASEGGGSADNSGGESNFNNEGGEEGNALHNQGNFLKAGNNHSAQHYESRQEGPQYQAAEIGAKMFSNNQYEKADQSFEQSITSSKAPHHSQTRKR